MKSDSPEVSFVITGYNAAGTARASVMSALSQHGVTCEVIYVDDGSTDGSVEVLGSIHDPRLTLMSMDKVGRAVALNAGVASARCETVAILDADDQALPGRAATQLAFLRAHPRYDVVGGQLEVVDPAGRVDRSGRMRFPVTAGEIDRWIRRGRMPIAHPAMVFKKRWFEGVGGYDPSVLRAEDFDILLRGWEPGRYGAVPEVVTRYRSDLFPTWAYWRREREYSRAVHARWSRADSAPLRVHATASDVAKDSLKWSGQLCRHLWMNRSLRRRSDHV